MLWLSILGVHTFDVILKANETANVQLMTQKQPFHIPVLLYMITKIYI